MSKTIIFSTGPRICIALECDDQGALKKSSLSLATEFTCTIVGKPSKSLKEALLIFFTQYIQHTPSEIALLPNDLSPFQTNVLNHMKKVPFGSLITYGQLALKAGHPKAARAVG